MKLHALRSYQLEQINYLRNHDKENICIQSPTGSGKSNLLGHRLQDHLNNNEKVLILAPKQELCDNIHLNMIDVATVAYSGKNPSFDKSVLITTPQSARKHLLWFKPDRVMIDECHHVAADNQSKLLKKLGKPLEGFTATPNRLDGKGLYEHFQRLSIAPNVEWFINQGYLSPFELIQSEAPIFESSSGDALGEQQNIFIPHIAESVQHWLDVGRKLKTLVFCATIKHADLMLQQFLKAGIRAAVVHSENSTNRDEILRAFRLGKIQVLINVEFFTEGVDVPDIECVMLCRFTYSTALYLQMCLDLETEILTVDGFKKHDQLTLGDKVAVYKDGLITWEHPKQIIKRKLEPFEAWVEYDTSDVNYKVTDQHEMLVSFNKNEKEKAFKKVKASSLVVPRSYVQYPISGNVDYKASLVLKNCEIEFIGLFLTDGSLKYPKKYKAKGWNPQGVTIYQQSHQKDNCKYIERVLKDCGFNFKKYEYHNLSSQYNRNSSQFQYFVNWSQVKHLEQHLDKKLSNSFKHCISEDQLVYLLEACHIGDGAKQLNQNWIRRSYHISTGNLTFAENLQYVCILRGYKCNITESVNVGSGNKIYILHIKKKKFKVTSHHQDNRKSPNFVKSKIGDECWCIETETGTIVTRRNGKVLIMGNCGRVLRFVKGKIALILDLANNSYYHGSVDSPFHWSLEGQAFRASTNQDSIQNRCVKCASILCHKNNVKEDALVSCLKCREINQVVVVKSSKKSQNSKLHEVFNIEELHRIEDTSITLLTRILMGSERKKFSKEKKITAISALGIDQSLKKKALIYVGMSEKEYDFYFGD